MGSRKSSSKNKSSKKKRPKISSKIRKRKSRRNKSKKLSTSEDDMSSSDYSSSPESSSSTSSEDVYSRKSRRHSRDVKRVKKRTRRRSSSRDVSEGSPPVKKRKRSNRKSQKLKKKKRRRYASVSSRSSDSRSCSSCQHDNSIGSRRSDSRNCSPCQYGTTTDSEDNDLPNNRIKSRRKTEEKRIPDEPSDEKRSGSRGLRCSSCNYHACSCNTTRIGNEYVEEHYPKRLRSVITVPEKTDEKEGEEQGTDMLKEEILNRHHDCPSWSNDDNIDIENKQKLASYSCFSSNHTMQVDNSVRDDTFPPDNETFGPTQIGSGIDPHSNEVNGVSLNKGGQSGISDNIANSGFKDLETVLRKKALENLQKFRKGVQTSIKSGAKEKKNGHDVNRLSSSTTEVVLHKSSVQENKEGLALNRVIGSSSRPVINKGLSHSINIEINTPVEGNNGKRSGYIKQCVMQPADRSTLSQSPEKEDHTTGPNFLDEPQPGKLSSSTTVQTYKKENLLPSKRSIIKTPAPVRPGVRTTGTSVDLDIGAVNASIPPTEETTSSVKSTSEGNNTSKPQPNETKDGSEFEQKTMSVMRGGEMVQVSYKVYIPKRAATLARRQLKR